jgi:hypothetical protein
MCDSASSSAAYAAAIWLAYRVPLGTTPWPIKMPPLATTVTTGLRWQAGNNSPAIMPARRWRLSSHATNRRRSWCVTAGVRPAVMRVYSARHDGGGVHATKPVPPTPPMPLTPPPGTWHHPSGDPTAHWAARLPASVPPDGTTAPRIQWRQSSTGRPCRAVRLYSRPPQRSTTGRAWGGGGGGAGRRRHCGGGGGGGGGCARRGGVAMLPPPLRPCCNAVILLEGALEFHQK